MRHALAFSLLVAACNGDRVITTDADASTAGPQTTSEAATAAIPTTGGPGSTTDVPATACSCAAYYDHSGCGDDELWPQIADCELPTICPTVTVDCPRPNQDLYSCESALVIDSAALTCALTAMRDRTPGRFIIEGLRNPGWFFDPPVSAVRLLGDERAATTVCYGTDTGTKWDAPTSTLAPPAHFEDCLAKSSDFARHDCALAGLQDPISLPLCGPETPTETPTN